MRERSNQNSHLIKVHPSFYIVALGFVLTGYYLNLLIFTSLIIIHELGHFIAAKLCLAKVKKIMIYPELDQTLTSRDIINTKMRAILDEATDPWGIKVNRVEVKNIIPPRDIQEAMEKQMRAERERREKILQAEGEKKSSVLIAEGEKESAILRAEANKQSKIKMAEGEAEALLKLKQAEAEGIKLLKEAKADKSVIALKSLDALGKVADGKATKIIIPSDLQNIASLGVTLSETLKKEEDK